MTQPLRGLDRLRDLDELLEQERRARGPAQARLAGETGQPVQQGSRLGVPSA
ncbi:hypothetical protein ABTZ93_40320 [Streptomyces sp. NPDC097941]|uniref:hypothetical protein n=1 Tax=Streptomyces sp. NPDC097941 TaxID=3155685 RepID=UPI00331883B2